MDRLRLVVARPVVARYAAPLLFLLAATAVVLVVRSALRSGSAPAARSAPAATRAHPAHRAPRRASAPKRYYVIQSGDTLGGIAGRFGTSVDVLLRLNPGVQPAALRPGTELRVR